jgi:proline iminopeptidase
MSKFTTKLGTTYYIKKGKLGNKFPVISCHGGPGGTHASVKPILDLAHDRQVVVYDQIGSGLSSDIPKSKWTIEVFCKNLNELITHLGFEQVILHGSSWGGTLILEYFKRHPGKVAGLIFHSSLISEKHWRADAKRLISKLPASTRKVIHACEEVGATDSKVYQEAMTVYYKKHLCRDLSVWKKKTKAKFNEKLYNHMWGPSEFCATGTLKKYNGIPTLKKVKVPTLFICGQYDEATPESSRYFASLIKSASFKMIKNASHSSLKEKKTETLRAFEEFLAKNRL